MSSDRNALSYERGGATQITGTIASVRRSRLPDGDVREDAELALGGVENNSQHSSLSNRDSAEDGPSFIAEASFVHAPLNSRVPMHSPSAKHKGKAKAVTLDRVPLETQEVLILEDLLFVLTVSEATVRDYEQQLTRNRASKEHTSHIHQTIIRMMRILFLVHDL